VRLRAFLVTVIAAATFAVGASVAGLPRQVAAATCASLRTDAPPTSTVYLPNVTKTLGAGPFALPGAAGWVTPFIIQNTGSVSTSLEVSFYAFADGSCVARRTISALAPATSYADVPNNDSDLPGDSQFSVVVRSFGAAIVGVVNEHNLATREALSYDGFNSGASSIFLPNITRRFNGFHTPFIVQNLGNRAATVQATFVSFDGSAPRVDVFRTIDAGRSAFVEPNVESGLVDGKQYSVTVTNPAVSCPTPPAGCQTTVPLAVVVNTHNDDPGAPAPIAYATDGITAGAATVYGPYAARNAGTDVESNAVSRVSTIVIQNVGTAPTTPSLTFTPLGGGTAQTLTSPAAVAPGAAWAFDPRFTVGTTTPCTTPSATCLGDGEYSFIASAPGGSIAVTVNVISPTTAMGYTGSPVAAGRVFLPNVTRTFGGAAGWATPIRLQSVTSSGATLKWYRFSDGVLITTQTVSTPAGTGIRVDPRNVGGLSDDTQYAVVAEGTSGTIAAIVIELAALGDNAMTYEGFPDPCTVPSPSPSPAPSASPSPSPSPSPSASPSPSPSPSASASASPSPSASSTAPPSPSPAPACP